MPKITDATPWLNSIKTEFNNAISSAKNTAKSKLSDIKTRLVNEINTEINSTLNDISTAAPSDVYMDSTKFRTAISTIKSNASKDISNVYNTVTNKLKFLGDNVYIDYNYAMSKAYDNLNLKISEAVYTDQIDDKDYSKKYETFKTDVSKIVDDANMELDNAFTETKNAISNAYLEGVKKIQSKIDSIILDRPLLRPTGNIIYPQTPTLDAENEYGIELTNVGRKPWKGTIGIKIIDQYYKTVEDDGTNATPVTIDPGKTVFIKRKIMVPKVIQTKDGPRNLGDELTVKLYLVTK